MNHFFTAATQEDKYERVLKIWTKICLCFLGNGGTDSISLGIVEFEWAQIFLCLSSFLFPDVNGHNHW